MKQRFYVGITKHDNRHVIKSPTVPVVGDKGPFGPYCYVIGPFRTRRGANFMAYSLPSDRLRSGILEN